MANTFMKILNIYVTRMPKGTEFMRIYHGSENIIEKPEYGKGKTTNDYGRGFYCTESFDLAREWGLRE